MRVVLTFLIILLALPVSAQDTPHTKIRKGLLHLEAKGTASKAGHDLIGVTDGVISQGTGFFVGEDGFILTTRHFLDPLEKAEALGVTITASIGSADSDPIPVLIASELKRVDLMLLKANMPFDKPPPVPLTMGRTSTFDPNDPIELFTSGFHGDNYRQKTVEFNRADNDLFPFAWEFNVKTNSGQSGSPVYDAEGNVIGVIKGTLRTDDELTLMIPIDFAMPLIGHLEIDRLKDRVNLLLGVIGEMTADDPPLHDRLRGIEDNMTELSNRFTWSAYTHQNGDLVVRYEKLISGGTQIDNVRVKVTPNMRVRGPDGLLVTQGSPLRLGGNSTLLVSDKFLDPDERIGEFVVRGVREKLNQLVQVDGSIYIDDPYRDLEVSVIPAAQGKNLNTKNLTVIPTYKWDVQ